MKREEEFVPDFGTDPDNEAVAPARRAAILRLIQLDEEERDDAPDPEIFARDVEDRKHDVPVPGELEASGDAEERNEDGGATSGRRG